MASDLQPRCSRLKTTELMKNGEGGGGNDTKIKFGFHLELWLVPSPRGFVPGCLLSHPHQHLELESPFLLPCFSTCSLQLQPPFEGIFFDKAKISNPFGLKPSCHQRQSGHGDQGVQGEDERGRVSLPFVKWEINTTFPLG